MNQEEQFQAMYVANKRRVHELLGRIVGLQEAEDLTQIVFAKAAEALSNFRGEAQESTWLYRIAINVAADWMRSRSARDAKLTDTFSDDADELSGDSASAAPCIESQSTPEQLLAHKDMRACLLAEIGHLTPEHQAILMLRDLGGFTDEDVAKTFDITLGTAKVRLHRARQQLRKAVEQRCDFYSQELSCAPSSPTCCSPPNQKDGRKPIR